MEQKRECPHCRQWAPLSDFRRLRPMRGEREGRLADRCVACELQAKRRKIDREIDLIFERRRSERDAAREAAKLARLPAGIDGE